MTLMKKYFWLKEVSFNMILDEYDFSMCLSLLNTR